MPSLSLSPMPNIFSFTSGHCAITAVDSGTLYTSKLKIATYRDKKERRQDLDGTISLYVHNNEDVRNLSATLQLAQQFLDHLIIIHIQTMGLL